MDTEKKLSVSLLSEMLTTYQSTKQFALYKLNYLTPCCPNAIHEMEEFAAMLVKANLKISQLSACIAWLSKEPESLQT